MKSILVICFCIYTYRVQASPIQNDVGPDTLELLHVVFRHGDRTPESGYPDDPYINFPYYPVGFGQLTNPGKVKAYNVGVTLKQKYGHFIGDVYTPALIDPISSYYPRCKSTLQLVLAALFPPTKIQLWNSNLAWQPIPYTYNPGNIDFLFWSMTNCPNFEILTEETRVAHEDHYQDVINYLLVNSGYNLSGTGPLSSSIGLQLYSTLKSEQEWGLTLPSWTDSVWPEPITSLAALEWENLVGPRNLSTILGGFIMSKVLNDTYSKINNIAAEKDRKIHLYSGHDLTVASVLGWLGVFFPHNPPYGATVTIEIHNISGNRAVRIFYEDYTGPKPHQIRIPKCGDVCPLDTFVQLYQPYLRPEQLCG